MLVKCFVLCYVCIVVVLFVFEDVWCVYVCCCCECVDVFVLMC